ncbi:MAG: Tripartite ATP-independent periplasmic transporter [Syntrophorhabdaceae bacterium PtaU1.Bin034]|jgi:TRAP-type C4-dicarboxylate transport system permease small subunit|nr:MAG: Tripartite ATP-independent periplasmic transporter [Syntrophorhabdaceae bacterium PtaU1.Bin034]
MKQYLSIMQVVNKGMDFVAGTFLVLIMLLTSVDVVLRYLGHPIQGSYDLVTFGAAFVIGFALPRTSWNRMHITVDILVEKIPGKRVILDLITRVMAIALFALIGWNFMKLGASFSRTGEGTLTLGVPLYPIAYALGFSSFLECLALLGDIVKIAVQRRTA